ncbi:Uncharacterised protein (plasmid) [Tsukamurella tyrosinosolvens]|uniref:Uncharacterized protein n=1 Tax=Tsukamurella tyrosinosolvens TaxID=57704 RepID=A0A1H4V4V1_TSUTY|nr:hypothetical protein [Tsukamurella tyrosinosolvens]KXO91060.1 hypothetical protein AXK58_21760 [Tsukamurella tyrosinosolvens]SEC75551.1 hypothetical protein SAMN04489793_3129 [Tsukamurella tyrosinosolvens]VEH90706.1 Uncharacterised protein [Tsukamurella tyrosinosolvens]
MPSLTEEQRQQVLDDLDKGTNAFGPLSFAIRSRLSAVINHQSQDTWNDAYSIILDGTTFATLWQAVLEHTDYAVTSRELDGAWPQVPTQEQLLIALHFAVREGA